MLRIALVARRRRISNTPSSSLLALVASRGVAATMPTEIGSKSKAFNLLRATGCVTDGDGVCPRPAQARSVVEAMDEG